MQGRMSGAGEKLREVAVEKNAEKLRKTRTAYFDKVVSIAGS